MKLEDLSTIVFRDMPIAIVILDISGCIMLHNPAFESMFGFGIDPHEKRSFGELIEQSALNNFLTQMSALVKGDQDELELTCRYSGLRLHSERWMHTRILPLAQSNGELFYALIDDVSNNMDENLNLRREKDLAEQATRSKSSFLANMSHEIRTPIHTVTGMTELLLDTPLDDEQQEYIKQIRFSAEVLLGLINDILDFSKIEAGRLNLEIIDFNLTNTVEDAVDMQCLEAFKKGLEIVVSSDERIPHTLRGDPVRIRQIITNLLSNALKFTKTGEIFVKIELESINDNKAFIRCSVSDTGIGIPSDKIDRLFQSFSQVDASMTRRFGGTGLGLSICRSLIHMMDGEIGVHSQAGQGSTFWFNLPLPISAIQDSVFAPAKPDFCNELKVLIVDDNATSRAVVRDIIEPYCAIINEANDGAQGLSALLHASQKHLPYDAALIDLQMPGIDGWQFASEVNANKEINGTRLFLMNPPGKMGGEAKMKLLNWFDDYISKPVKRNELLAALNHSLKDSLDLSSADLDLSFDESQIVNVPKAIEHWKILVAEDHFVNQKLFQTILKRLGHSVIVASNGLEALQIGLKELPDIIFMDVQMPEMNGYEATQALRQSGFRNPVIAVTANALKGDQEKCLQAGMNDYLPKPFQRSDVEQMVTKWINRPLLTNGKHSDPFPELTKTPELIAGEKTNKIYDPSSIFDPTQALQAFMQDRQALVGVLKEFCERTPQQIERIQTFATNNKLELVGLEAHMIKGSAWNLGMGSLGNIAGKLETACRLYDHSLALELIPKLNSTWEEFSVAVHSFLEE